MTESVEMYVRGGSHIKHAITRAIQLSTDQGTHIWFNFNDVKVTVAPDSDAELIYRDCDRALSGYIAGAVGPHPKARLSKEDLLGDKRVRDRNERKWRKQEARWAAEEKSHRERLETLIAKAPDMEYSDKEEWDKAVPRYDYGITVYAEHWARLMQLRISEGNALADIWESTSREADVDGQSGYSQSTATHLLTECWVHGAELRQLYNAFWGVEDQSGTVNPAILILSPV